MAKNNLVKFKHWKEFFGSQFLHNVTYHKQVNFIETILYDTADLLVSMKNLNMK